MYFNLTLRFQNSLLAGPEGKNDIFYSVLIKLPIFLFPIIVRFLQLQLQGQ